MKMHGLVRIGNAPELRYSSSGVAILRLSLAYNYGKDKDTQWINGTLFGKRAEALAQYLSKGQLIYAELSDVHVDIYKDKDDKERVSVKAIVQEVGLTGKADDKPASTQAAEQTSVDDMDPPF
jgi:single-strand DNA-binding protein